jgi:hypothetical protein
LQGFGPGDPDILQQVFVQSGQLRALAAQSCAGKHFGKEGADETAPLGSLQNERRLGGLLLFS